MNNKLEEKFLELENTRNEYFEAMDSLSEDQLNKKPTPNDWSILEVVYHIQSSESKSTGYMIKKMQGATEVKDGNLKSAFNSTILNIALKSSIKFKAPRVLDAPNGPYKSEELREKWDNIRMELKNLLEGVPEEYMKKQLFKHPSAGRMSILQALQFMNIHLKRHLAQVLKIKKAIT